jgi:hypothetical protein
MFANIFGDQKEQKHIHHLLEKGFKVKNLLQKDGSKIYVSFNGQEELVSCSSDYSTRWLAIK